MQFIKDFPKPGITFCDVWPLFQSQDAVDTMIDRVVAKFRTTLVDAVVGVESRGFPLGAVLANRLRVPFVPIRKPGKLPGEFKRIEYKLEYGTATLEIASNSLKPRQATLVVDDILATGGTLVAAHELIKTVGATVAGYICIAEVTPSIGGAALVRERTGLEVFLCGADTPPEAKNEVSESFHGQYLVLAAPSMMPMAHTLCAIYGGRFEVREIQWRRFPDGNPDIQFPADIQGRRVVFLAAMHALPTDTSGFLDEQLMVMNVLSRHAIRSLHVLIPYFAVGTMERVEHPGTLATAETFANVIASSFNAQALEGIPNVTIIDLHNPTTRFYFNDKVRLHTISMVPELLERLRVMHLGAPKEPAYGLCFPDEGSYKRFRALVPSNVPMIECGKDRATRDVKVARLYNCERIDFAHVVIVDDLVHSGGTLLGCVKALRDLGVQRVSMYCTHGVFERREFTKFLDAGVENFWITDTVPERAALLHGKGPFRAIPVAPAFANHLFSTFHRGSKEVTIHLASRSAVKAAAVFSAAKYLFGANHVGVVSYDSKSGVPEQPVGLDETTLGAMNRARYLGYVPDVVSVENGVEDQYDFAVVALKRGDFFVRAVSEKVKIDTRVWEVWQRDRTRTVGSIYAELFGYDADNWHYGACGKSRQFLIRDAIIEAFQKA